MNWYQDKSRRTLIYAPGFEIAGRDMMLIWCAIGLTGEAGEVADHVKKGVFHQHGIDNDKFIEELGDVMWYVASLATLLGVDLDMVMAKNVNKLAQRYPNGYSSEDSINRKKEL